MTTMEGDLSTSVPVTLLKAQCVMDNFSEVSQEFNKNSFHETPLGIVSQAFK